MSVSNNPNPVELPPCEHAPAPYTGPSRDEVLKMRRRYVNPGVLLYHQDPIQIVEGHMQYLWDDTGQRYLDAIAGIVVVSVGHCHPRIVKAVREQVGKLTHTTTLYLNPEVALYAKKLAEHFPDASGLESTYFTNSGSESNELASIMVRLHTGNFDIIALGNGYHGGLVSTMSMTAMSNWKFPLPDVPGIKHAPPGYCYRCPLSLEYPSCNMKCAHSVASLIEYETSGSVAAFIAEPIQGIGGVVEPPPEYFAIIYDIVRAHGGLCISDEVQTGFGRTGTAFWGFENYGAVPDVVTMAKGIGNGWPLGTVTTRKEIAECLSERLHFNTFAGQPVAMIQGIKTLEVIDDENIQQRANKVGGYLKEGLLTLQESHKLIGDVRGRGLLLGIELVRDRDTKEPATQEAARIHELAKDRNLLIGKGGVHGNVLRIKPLRCITKADVDFIIDCLDRVFTDQEKVLG